MRTGEKDAIRYFNWEVAIIKRCASSISYSICDLEGITIPRTPVCFHVIFLRQNPYLCKHLRQKLSGGSYLTCLTSLYHGNGLETSLEHIIGYIMACFAGE